VIPKVVAPAQQTDKVFVLLAPPTAAAVSSAAPMQAVAAVAVAVAGLLSVVVWSYCSSTAADRLRWLAMIKLALKNMLATETKAAVRNTQKNRNMMARRTMITTMTTRLLLLVGNVIVAVMAKVLWAVELVFMAELLMRFHDRAVALLQAAIPQTHTYGY
jgi:hypothetical protein